MPTIYARHIPYVTHIGFLEKPVCERPAGLDGPGISVSTDPDLWRRIKGLNGPQFELSYSAAHWVDALSFSPADRQDIEAWMLMMRYMRKIPAWQVTCLCETTGDLIDATLESREEAARLAGRSLQDELEAFAVGQGAVEAAETFKLEKRAVKRLGGWPDPLHWYDAAILLYTREVILPKRPMVVGVWWDEVRCDKSKTAPSGVIFPERLNLFEVENDEGDVMAFTTAFPDFPIPDEQPEMTVAIKAMAEKMRKKEQELISAGVDPKVAARLASEP